MKKNIISLLVVMLGVSAVMAAPFEDVSSTSVSLEEEQTSLNSEHLTVKISRVDDLVDDNGEVLIERIMGVKLGFDIEDDKITLNGVPVELGPSNVEVEAVILADESLMPKDGSTPDLTALENALDIGLVTVEVEASVERITTDEGIPIRHIVVSERVVEINGETVLQTIADQQILDVFENGTVVETIVAADAKTTSLDIDEMPDSAMVEPGMYPTGDLDTLPCGDFPGFTPNRFTAWFNSLNPHFRMAMLGFISGIVLYAILVLVRRAIHARRGYAQVPITESETIWSDEKDAVVVEVESIDNKAKELK
jgi:hypothetical protein